MAAQDVPFQVRSASDLRAVAKRIVGWDSAPRGIRGFLREMLLRDMDVGLRYTPAVDAAARARRVLEVGSGPYGIAPFVRRHVVGADLSFAGPRHRLLHPVKASGTALPFPDRTFDVVLCFDVLEHVPRDARPQVVSELVRVCGGELLVAVPFGDAAAAADAEEAAAWERRYGTPHPWLHEHLERGLPTREDVEAIIATAGGGTLVERHPYTPLFLWRLARHEETRLRPDLMLLRRIVLPPLLPLLARLKRGPFYRLLLRFDVTRSGVAGHA